MSYHARGIVLDATVDRLVIEATALDVARYAPGTAVAAKALVAGDYEDVDWALDWDAKRKIAIDERDLFFGGPSTSAQRVRAVLITACGCEKRVVVCRPLPRTVRVAISSGVNLSRATGNSLWRVREFELDRIYRTASDYRDGTIEDCDVVSYRERP